MPVAMNLCPHKPSRNGLLPSLFGLIEATSNAAAEAVVFWAWDSARLRVAWSKPNTTGEATAINASAVSNSFLLKARCPALGHSHTWFRLLIFRRLLDVIDDKNFDRTFL